MASASDVVDENLSDDWLFDTSIRHRSRHSWVQALCLAYPGCGREGHEHHPLHAEKLFSGGLRHQLPVEELQASHPRRGEVFLADAAATAWIISGTALTGDEHRVAARSINEHVGSVERDR